MCSFRELTRTPPLVRSVKPQDLSLRMWNLATSSALSAHHIADGVRRATDLRPAEIAFGSVEAPEHVFIRRWFLKEGTMPPNPFGKIDKVKMNPGAGNANLVEPAGKPDPTVSFIAFRARTAG